MSHSPAALIQVHASSHDCLRRLIEHCRGFTSDEIDREFDGFGYPSVRLQLHHGLGAERYWLGVLEGRIDVDEDADRHRTIEDLEGLRARVFANTRAYLDAADESELNTARVMTDWRGNEVSLVPADVVLRTQFHVFHHQGQITALCRLLGRPANGFDYPVA